MREDIELMYNHIIIPQKIIDGLKWENREKLRLWIEDDDFLIIGKTQSVDEVVESINKSDKYSPQEYLESYMKEWMDKMQHKRPIRDTLIDVTLKELLELVDLLDKRVRELEGKH